MLRIEYTLKGALHFTSKSCLLLESELDMKQWMAVMFKTWQGEKRLL